jgi:alkylation response protein AidB-like acyl-CoA dehydrogenase
MDFGLSDRERLLLELARAFRREVIDPLEPHRREWVSDPAERFPWEVVVEGSRRGLRTLTVPERYGGWGATTLELALVVEELAAGDMGIAVIFDQTWKVCDMIEALATTEQKRRFYPRFVQDDRCLLAIGVADPDHTTDVSLSKRLQDVDGVRVGLSTTARQDGEDWVVDGRKMMPSLASTASVAVVMAQTEPDRAIHDGASYFLVPTDTPGFRVGTVWDKISQRLADNAEMVFEGMRLPADALLGDRGQARSHPTTSGGNIEAAATTLGSARAAYEAAVAWSRSRIQGGRPLIEQQAVALLLGEMAIALESARTLTWRAASAFDAGDRTTPLQFMAKVHAAGAAVDVCLKALDIFGGKGILLDTPVQKHLRDCLSFLHSDGTQQSRLLLLAERIRATGDPTLVPMT